jgi:outer membrane biosynthesis protein TonB
VHTLPGFDVFFLSDRKKDTGHVATSIELHGQDLLKLQKDNLQIFVRHVAAPPKVASAPFLKRDPDFRKYLSFFMLLVGFIAISFNVIDVPEDPDEDELAPERLASILYKQQLSVSKNVSVEKTKEAPKEAQKAPQKTSVEKKVVKEKQPEVVTPDVAETKDQTKKPDPGKRTAEEKKIVKQGMTPVTIPDNRTFNAPAAKGTTSSPKSSMPTAKNQSAVSEVQTKSAGHVEVYKSADFSSSVSSLVAKGGSLSGVKTQGIAGSGGGAGMVGIADGVVGGSGTIKTSTMTTQQGSLVGAATGALGDSKGAEGLSAKRAIYTAGIPGETVVLGSMDPDTIRRILLEHLPQFRYCYQKELERTGSEVSGAIKLNFTIGASGHVAQAGVDGASNLPTDVKKCVVGVLRGIQFPEPMGGGTVEVKQPMNFYPKKI